MLRTDVGKGLKLRLRFSAEVPICRPAYQKSWLSVPESCEKISDLIKLIKGFHMPAEMSAALDLYLTLRGYAVLPEENVQYTQWHIP